MKIDSANHLGRDNYAFSQNIALVKGKDDELKTWKEQTTLITVSRTGAGFFLQRPCEVGRLLSLMAQIPRHLRSYNRDKEYYRVWGIVQHCMPDNETGRFQVGIAFIGREAPSAYYNKPGRCFRIVGINGDGLWKVEKLDREFIKRKNTRFVCSLDVELATGDAEPQSPPPVPSVTEDISRCGTALISSLKLNVGDSVRFTSKEPPFSSLAVVRNLKLLGTDQYRINLEFIGAEFPVRDINEHQDRGIELEDNDSPELVTSEMEPVDDSDSELADDGFRESETIGTGSDDSADHEVGSGEIETAVNEAAIETE